MMNLNKFVIVAVAVVIGFCGNVHSDSTEMDRIEEACRVQEKATDADIEMWKNDAQPKPRIVKCLDACVGEKMGMMTNKKLNVEAVMKFYASQNPDEKSKSNMKDILNECKGVTDDDRCECSVKILKCINDGARKRGMKEIF